MANWKTIYDAFKNAGYVYDEKEGKVVRKEIKDFIEKYDSPVWLTKTINVLVRESIQPVLTIKNLFRRINTQPNVSVQLVKTISAADIGSLDVADGQEYPTLKLDEGQAGYEIIHTQKSGIQFIVTDTMKKASQYDIIQMHIEQATYALARHLEKKALNILLNLGTVTHDNHNPAASIHGITTGRDQTGAPNGSVTVDDLIEAYTDLMLAGYRPDTIIVSPLIWAMWMKDPILRYFAITASNPSGLYNKMPGEVSPMWEGGQGPSGYGDPANPAQTGKELLPNTLAPQVPSYFPYPIRVITTHFMPIRIVGSAPNQKHVTDIIVADSRYIGVNVVEEDVTVDQNVDWFKEATYVRIKTKQGFGILEEGKAVGVIKNVVVGSDNNFFVSPMISPSVDLPVSTLSIDRTNAVV